jgi:hypothetical protein
MLEAFQVKRQLVVIFLISPMVVLHLSAAHISKLLGIQHPFGFVPRLDLAGATFSYACPLNRLTGSASPRESACEQPV